MGQKTLVAKRGGVELKIPFDAVLFSVGRKPNLPKGLATAGIELTPNKKNIAADGLLRTTNKRVYVCGDIAGQHQFTHAAELHAGVILRNFFSPFKKKLSTDHLSWVTYTDPEIATFGLRENDLVKRGIKYQTLTQDFSKIDRGITDSAKGKLILFIAKNKILGGSLIAPNAGEIIQELILANTVGLDVKDIFNKTYPYPTASRVNKAAITQLFAGKLTDFNKKLLQFLYRLF